MYYTSHEASGAQLYPATQDVSFNFTLLITQPDQEEMIHNLRLVNGHGCHLRRIVKEALKQDTTGHDLFLGRVVSYDSYIINGSRNHGRRLALS